MPVNSVTGESIDTGGGGNQNATALALATSGTIPTAGLDVSRINPAAAVTGVILQAGTYPGQRVCVVNEAAAGSGFSATSAAVATGLVSTGVANVMAANQARTFVWTGTTWYPEL